MGRWIWPPAFAFYTFIPTINMADQKKTTNNKAQPPKTPRRPRRGRGGMAQSRGDSKSLSAPVAKTKQNRTPRPKMVTLPNGDCHIVHREYIQDVVAAAGTPSAFTAASLAINPGQVATFPWLSRIAANYESYVFDKLAFSYETEASTTLGGTVVLSVDYDASDAAPSSKQQAMAYRRSVRTAPWTGVRHVSMREDLHKNKTNFVRIGTQPAGTDIKTFDIGNLFLISQGISTASATLGELYVEYSLTLMTPVYEPLATTVFGGTITGANTMTPANPLGIAPLLDAQSQGIAVNAASGVTFSNNGWYLVTLNVIGTGITVGALSSATLAENTVESAGTNATFVFYCNNTAVTTRTFTITGTTITSSTVRIAIAPTLSLT